VDDAAEVAVGEGLGDLRPHFELLGAGWTVGDEGSQRLALDQRHDEEDPS
jgi:hypothetical protein